MNYVALLEKLQTLSADRIADVANFIESLTSGEPSWRLSGAPAFAAAWGNPEDDDFDAL